MTDGPPPAGGRVPAPRATRAARPTRDSSTESSRAGALPTRRSLLAAAAAFAGGCSVARVARGASVPLVYDETGTLLLAARVDGREPRRFVLDTGASRSLLAAAYARELALPLRDGGMVEGSAGVVAARAAEAAIDVPGLERSRVDFTVYEFASHDAQCVGILGAELLRRAPFVLRYRARELVWHAARPATVIPLHLDNGIPRIVADVGGVELTLRLDTGASLPPGEDAYVNVTRAEAKRLGLDGRPHAVWSATGTGGAKLSLPVHRLPDVRLGTRTLPRAFAIVQPAVGYFARDDAVGFLGNAVLDKLDPYVDYAGGAFGCTA